MQEMIKARAKQLLSEKKADRVIAWKTGEFFYDITPAVFETPEEIDRDLIWDGFTAANVSKYLIAQMKNEGVSAVFLKPCDSYSFSQLLKEHRIDREKVYIVGLSCDGKYDIEALRAKGLVAATDYVEKDGALTFHTLYGDKSFSREDALAERCRNCKSRKVVLCDEMLGDNGDVRESERFAEIEALEEMTPEERFAFWQKELSRCIRCNACRNVCPACTCEKCVFDNPKSGIENKAPASSFEEQNFHLIRAFHVAGRCTDCGECSRVCPQNIPLHLINRKFIKDINAFWGEYQAGEDLEEKAPLNRFDTADIEPAEGLMKGGK